VARDQYVVRARLQPLHLVLVLYERVGAMENIRSGSTFRFVDLFAGIGGFHLALEALGGRCVLASEIDAACQEVYRGRFPETPLVGDIRGLSQSPHGIPDHDVLAAGFPCQPFSKSGFQLGLRDKIRGTLFFEIMEIVRARHPRFVLLENVRNIAGPRHVETWQTVVLALREEGYVVSSAPMVVSPHELPRDRGGAPQVRDRVFIVGEYAPALAADEVGPLIEAIPVPGWDRHTWRIDDYLDSDSAIPLVERYQLRSDEEIWLEAWNDFIRRMPREQLPGFPIWVDAFKLRPSIHSSLPLWKADFNRKNSALYREHQRWIDRWSRYWRVPTFPASRRKFEWQARGWHPDVWRLVIHFRPSGIRVKPPTYLPALVAITQTSIIGSRRRRITPREAARLQGFPDDFQLHPSDSVAYRQLGNAVNVGVARFVARAMLESGATRAVRQERLRLVS
jgi:DNA (cytosine-5)-methyltransferase 1